MVERDEICLRKRRSKRKGKILRKIELKWEEMREKLKV